MIPHTCLLALVVLVLFGAPAWGADASGDAVQAPETPLPADAPAPKATTQPDVAAESAPSKPSNDAPPAPDADVSTKATTVPSATRAPAPAAAVPAAASDVKPAPEPAAPEAVAASPAGAPAETETPGARSSTPATARAADAAPAAPTAALPPAPDAVETRAELLAARVSLMEQLLLAQHDREVNLYRDTIRTVTIFGGAFAGLCMIGLLAAAFLNYRALIAVQNVYSRTQGANGASPGATNGLLPAPAAAATATAPVPGIERVQASGQRFQSRMTGLEQRLAELEHLAGRDAAPAPVASDAEPEELTPPAAAEPALTPPPRPVVPRALILVHKAQTQSNLGKLSEALATLDDAAALDAAKTEVHLARGQVLEKLGRLGDALKAYDVAVEVDDQNTSALLLKAGVLNRQERFAEALACYERALEVHRASV